jgi:drug/metabolite transporter (DMT)-like permease
MILTETFILVLLIGFFGAFSSILKKSVLYVLDPIEFLMLTFFFEFIFMFLLFLFSGENIKKRYTIIKAKTTWKELGSVGLFALFITGLSFSSILLAKREKISKIDPLIAIIGTIFTFLGGVFVLNEHVTIKDYIAILFMIIGICIMGFS